MINIVRDAFGAGMSACVRVAGHTCARTVVLAPLRKVLRARPRGRDPSMGRARRYAVERTPSRARRHATHITVDKNRPTSARTFVARPAQANEVESARDGDHDNMRIMRQVNRNVQCAHLFCLVEMFERALRAG